MTIKEDDDKEDDDKEDNDKEDENKEDHIKEDDWIREWKVSTCSIAVVLGSRNRFNLPLTYWFTFSGCR